MAFKVKSNIELFRKLITSFTGCEACSNEFKKYESIALSADNKIYDNIIDKGKVKKHVKDLALRYQVDGFSDRADKLLELSAILLIDPKHEDEFRKLSFLLQMAKKPTNTVSLEPTTETPQQRSTDEDYIDWAKYLREGEDDLFNNYGSDSSNEFGDEEEDEEEEFCRPDNKDNEVAKSLRIEDVISQPSQGEHSWLTGHLNRLGESHLWLEKNLQPPWWDRDKQPSYSVWEEVAETVPATKLSEYKIIREILFLIQSPCCGRIFIVKDGKFVVSQDVTTHCLTKETFQRCMQRVCDILNILREFDAFQLQTGGSAKPPVTYLAWFRAATVYIRTLRGKALEIERVVFKQETTNTLLNVLHTLDPYFRTLDKIHNLFKRCMFFSWEDNPSWLCSVCVISELIHAIESSTAVQERNIFLFFFLISIEPYMNMTGRWLTEGTIEDDLQEYFIVRKDENFELRPYSKLLTEAKLKPAKLLENMTERLLSIGKTITFLIRLGKVDDKMRRQLKYSVFYDEFVKYIMHKLDELESSESAAITSECCNETVSCPSLLNIKGDPHEIACLLETVDPLLLLAFEENPVEIEPLVEESNSLLDRLSCKKMSMIAPLQEWITEGLNHVLNIFYNEASNVMEKVIFGKLKLSTHLALLKDVMFACAADEFMKCLYSQVETGSINWMSLSFELDEYVEKFYPNLSSRFAISFGSKSRNIPDVPENYLLRPVLANGLKMLDFFNRVHLKYQVRWPLTLIFSDNCIQQYNVIFQCLVKVKWALHLLQQLHFQGVKADASKEIKRNVHRLRILKFWLLNTMTTIHTSLTYSIYDVENVNVAKDMDKVIAAHNNYVSTVFRNVLQPGGIEDIVENFEELALMSYVLYELWMLEPLLLSSTVLGELEKMYSFYHAEMVTKIVKKFDEGVGIQTFEPWLVLASNELPFSNRDDLST